jgi:hypothetical protein
VTVPNGHEEACTEKRGERERPNVDERRQRLPRRESTVDCLPRLVAQAGAGEPEQSEADDREQDECDERHPASESVQRHVTRIATGD